MVVCKLDLIGDIGLSGGTCIVGDGAGLSGKTCSMGMDFVGLSGAW